MRVCRFGVQITHVVSFQIEMSKVQRYPILRWGEYFPDAVLVASVQVREGRTGDCSISGIDKAAASI